MVVMSNIIQGGSLTARIRGMVLLAKRCEHYVSLPIH